MPDNPAQPDEGAWSEYPALYRDVARQLTAPAAEVTPPMVEKVERLRFTARPITYGALGQRIARALADAEQASRMAPRCRAEGCGEGVSGVYLDYCRPHGELPSSTTSPCWTTTRTFTSTRWSERPARTAAGVPHER